ncbi:transmembrane protein, putative (macronuclear) [Tetrahymena thermophila SB210]|uniref:Transmembrane protein, putative n=1 Tax=Tetrahymena thermophila (strain SB210) TaxID=312017 RepID=I7LTC0_TETTS|nr:transmembrane protein, putative [Tetrahymena thermophila SB210]EAR84970.1 transmembrane protein, putative [Tetrahymena thermophila SB210]|eukprot:XP_001032633.1 transmembrane protein, putative [Tetrahymena thermophila SB210]
MKPSEQEIKEAHALKDALRSKSKFRPDYSQERLDQQQEIQKDRIKEYEIRNFREMLRLIPEVRKKIPKSEQETSIKLYDDYNNSVQKSTLFIIPISFFAFCNKRMQNLMGKPGTFILSIASTTMMTFTNLIFFQPLLHQEKIQRLRNICNQYKPIIRDQNYLDYLNFNKSYRMDEKLLQNEVIADRVQAAYQQFIPIFKEGKYTYSHRGQLRKQLSELEAEIDEDFRKQLEEGKEFARQVQQKMLQRELLKQQQEQQKQQEEQKILQQQK